MKRILRRRPTPATLIACLALFVSLGGVSWGFATGFIDSREIRNETIGSQDIRSGAIRTQELRDNEVRGRDIRNSTIVSRDVGLNGLEGADILESSLGPVPQAETLVDTAGFAPIPLGVPGSGAIGEPVPQFDVDPLRFVHLEGVVLSSGGVQPLATLPGGARPPANKRFVVYNETAPPAPALVTVQPDGDIVPAPGVSAGDELSLDGITFRAAG